MTINSDPVKRSNIIYAFAWSWPPFEVKFNKFKSTLYHRHLIAKIAPEVPCASVRWRIDDLFGYKIEIFFLLRLIFKSYKD